MLATYAILFLTFVHVRASDELDVKWVKPALGKIFASGETMQAEWRANTTVISPSFRLCAYAGSKNTARSSDSTSRSGGDVQSNCGPQIWPEVHHDDETYHVAMVAPNVAAEGNYTIQMEDNFQNTVYSPVFSIKPLTDSVSEEEVSTVSQDPTSPTTTLPVTQAGPPVVPLGNSQFPASVGVDSPPSAPTPSAPPSSILTPNSAPSPSQVIPSPAHAPAAPYTPTALGVPSFLAAHAPPPVAAIAVPASIAGAILLLASILGLDHHIKQRRLRKSEKEALAAKVAQVHSDEKRKEEERFYERFAPVPLYMPTVEYTQIPRRATRQSISARHPAVPRYTFAYPAQHTSTVPPPNSPPVYPLPGHPTFHSSHISLPPLRTTPPLSYPSGPQPNGYLPYTYAHERKDDTVPVTQSVLADYLPPPPALPRPPEGLLSAPHRAYLRRSADENGPLSDNPYVRSPRS